MSKTWVFNAKAKRAKITDKQRLDWLNKNTRILPAWPKSGGQSMYWVLVGNPLFRDKGDTIRTCTDRAMIQQLANLAMRKEKA